MDMSLYFGIAGLSATVILGSYSIYLVFRTRKYPGRIVFVKEACIGLFDTFVRNLPDLSILYLDKPVDENLVLLKGSLLNVGSKDISPNMIEEQICISLPEGFRWLAVSIVSTSSQFKSQAKITNEFRILFDLGLFRCREHLNFQAIAEVPASKNSKHSNKGPAEILESAIDFHHRIADTQKIKKQEVQPNDKKSKSFIGLCTFQVALCFIGLIVFGVQFWLKGLPTDIHYILTLDDAQEVEVKITPRQNGKLEVEGVESDYQETVPIEVFFNNRTWQPTLVVRKHIYLPLGLLGSMGLIFLALLIYTLWQRRRDAALIKLLGIHSGRISAKADDS